MAVSEVAQLQQKIATEYLSARIGLQGLACGVSKHQFITIKMEHMGETFEQLTRIVGSPEEAIQLVATMLDNLPEDVTRYALAEILRHELGRTEDTEILLDHIEEMWETIDLLIDRFGIEQARKIISVPSFDREPLFS